MGNTAHLTFKRRITVDTYYDLLQKVVDDTFGDAVTLEGDRGFPGVNVKTEAGAPLVQFFYESRGHISVDHRHGSVGYMVSDALLANLAHRLKGRVYETGNGEYMDLTRDYPVYFMDVIRRHHKSLSEVSKRPGQLERLVDSFQILEGYKFQGKFAKFWEHPLTPTNGVPTP